MGLARGKTSFRQSWFSKYTAIVLIVPDKVPVVLLGTIFVGTFLSYVFFSKSREGVDPGQSQPYGQP